MTARCSRCAINYPSYIHECRVCNEACDILRDEPDQDWQERVATANTASPIPPSTTITDVECWRLKQLLEAGYDVDLAELLARRPWHEVDLHNAVELVLERGCPPDLAAAILL